jgi:hypothetical protein
MPLRAWSPVLLGVVLLVACGSRDESPSGREQGRLDAVDRRLDALEQRLGAIERDVASAGRVRDDLHAFEQRLGAAEAKATQALDTAKAVPPPAPPAAAPHAPGAAAQRPAAVDPVQRREQIDALMDEYRRRLKELTDQQGAQANPADRMAGRRALRDWYIARRRAILMGRPLPD